MVKIKMVTAEKLRDKIDTEYEFFVMDMLKSSRENLFAKSGEIEMKKKITAQLRTTAESAKEMCRQKMYTENNLLDSFYRYINDHSKNEKNFEELFKNYLLKFQN